ncbi:MAG: hypothetical protein A2Z34_08550, partial [Planctomycetes bacterium RBG_16_59_8]
NKYYSAVRVVNARRAFTLLYKNSAEAIDMENQSFRNYDFESWVSESERKEAVGAPQCEYVRAPRFRVLVPKVIRLVTYDRMPMREVKFTRKNILARDGNRCQYCGKRASPSKLTIDHVIPKSRRGETVWNNVVTACHKCNAKKGNRTPAESGMKLLKKPEAPKKNPIVDEKMRTERYEVWRQFLTCQRIPPEM